MNPPLMEVINTFESVSAEWTVSAVILQVLLRERKTVSLLSFWRMGACLHSSSTQPVPGHSSRQDPHLVYFSCLFSTFAGSWKFHSHCSQKNAGEPLGCEQPLPLFRGGHTDVLLSWMSDCSLLWDPAGKMFQTMKSISCSCGAIKGTKLSNT